MAIVVVILFVAACAYVLINRQKAKRVARELAEKAKAEIKERL